MRHITPLREIKHRGHGGYGVVFAHVAEYHIVVSGDYKVRTMSALASLVDLVGVSREYWTSEGFHSRLPTEYATSRSLFHLE